MDIGLSVDLGSFDWQNFFATPQTWCQARKQAVETFQPFITLLFQYPCWSDSLSRSSFQAGLSLANLILTLCSQMRHSTACEILEPLEMIQSSSCADFCFCQMTRGPLASPGRGTCRPQCNTDWEKVTQINWPCKRYADHHCASSCQDSAQYCLYPLDGSQNSWSTESAVEESHQLPDFAFRFAIPNLSRTHLYKARFW